jgi:ferric-dicitrate binding protein FerR (iron transport regulator)
VDSHRPPAGIDCDDANDPIARVLKLAGARPQPDPARTADFKKALHAHWHQTTRPRAGARASAWLAVGAAAVAAAFILAWLQPWTARPPAATAVVGRVVRVEGASRVAVGSQMRAGGVIETATATRVALALDGGASLLVDVASRVVLVASRTVRVDRGAVYVDAGGETSETVLVQTSHGDVRDIGTQFEVRADGESLRVRVREGEVLVSRHDSEISARAGEALHVDSRGRYARSAIPTSGPDWAWTSAIAPSFQLEGSTVQQFLDWVAREQGWQWRFANSDTARRAAAIVTHGSIDGYTPEEALDLVLPTCGLSYVRNGNEVVVSLIEEPSPRDR